MVTIWPGHPTPPPALQPFKSALISSEVRACAQWTLARRDAKNLGVGHAVIGNRGWTDPAQRLTIRIGRQSTFKQINITKQFKIQLMLHLQYLLNLSCEVQ